MCLIRIKEVDDDDDVIATRRTTARQQIIYAPAPVRQRARITEAVATQYVRPPSSPRPIIRAVTPPRIVCDPAYINDSQEEVVTVHKNRTSPRASGISVSRSKRRSGYGSRSSVFIEQDRHVVAAMDERLSERSRSRSLSPRRSRHSDEGPNARRSMVIIKEAHPRVSGRLAESARIIVDDGGRRKEYYKRS